VKEQRTCYLYLAMLIFLAIYTPTDDELLPWVMCNKCFMWMHIECVPIGVDMTPIENDATNSSFVMSACKPYNFTLMLSFL
jgi:hypothetical protein